MNVKIAFRNLRRNKRRSLLCLLIIVAGVAILLTVRNYIAGVYWGLRMGEIMQHGHLQIAAEGYWSRHDERRYILSGENVSTITNILNDKREVSRYAFSLSVNGLLGTEERSTIVRAVGIEPEGFYGQRAMIVEGMNLFQGDYDRAIIGRGVRERIGVGIDEHVSIVAATVDGAFNAASLAVSGVFTVIMRELNAIMIFIPIDFARFLLNTDGVDVITVLLEEEGDTMAFSKTLKETLKEAGLSVEIKRWDELATVYFELKAWYNMIFTFISIVIFILVFLAILEIMSMAFYERFNEIGCLRAIGTKQSEVFLMLITEALILAVIGIAAGLVVGYGSSAFLNELNIQYYPPMTDDPVPVRFLMEPQHGVFPSILALAASLLSAVFPAMKVSRLNVVEVLRHT